MNALRYLSKVVAAPFYKVLIREHNWHPAHTPRCPRWAQFPKFTSRCAQAVFMPQVLCRRRLSTGKKSQEIDGHLSRLWPTVAKNNQREYDWSKFLKVFNINHVVVSPDKGPLNCRSHARLPRKCSRGVSLPNECTSNLGMGTWESSAISGHFKVKGKKVKRAPLS